MSKKRKYTNPILEAFALAGGLPISSVFVDEVDENDLGEGLSLEPVPEDELGEYKDDIRLNFRYLFKNGKKISDALFRIGGMGGKFKDGYCKLLEYDSTDKKSGSISVLINTDGDVVFESDGQFDYIYHTGGVIANKKDGYYNLLTGEIIAKGSSTLSSENYLFVENRYNHNYEIERYGKEIPIGVYKIDLKTGEFELFN